MKRAGLRDKRAVAASCTTRATNHEVVRSIAGHVTEDMTAYAWLADHEKHAALARTAREICGRDIPCDTAGPEAPFTRTCAYPRS